MGILYEPPPPPLPPRGKHRCDTPDPDSHSPGAVWGCSDCGKTWLVVAHSDLAMNVMHGRCNFWTRERFWERWLRRRRERSDRR